MSTFRICVIGTNPIPVSSDIVFVESISEADLVYGSKSSNTNEHLDLWITLGFVASKDQETAVNFVFMSGDQYQERILPAILEVEDKSPYPTLGYAILVDSQYLDLDTEKDSVNMQMKITRAIFGSKAKGWLYMSHAKRQIQTFKQIVPDAPFTVAVLNQDTPNAMPLDKVREELELDDDVKVIPCDPKNKADVKNVLLELLISLESTPTIEQVIATISQA